MYFRLHKRGRRFLKYFKEHLQTLLWDPLCCTSLFIISWDKCKILNKTEVYATISIRKENCQGRKQIEHLQTKREDGVPEKKTHCIIASSRRMMNAERGGVR